jgi:hypothetical protein
MFLLTTSRIWQWQQVGCYYSGGVLMLQFG